jgi:DNA-3-methyladenine glycosylase I
MKRCFGEGDPLYSAYHDEEWGIPVHDDRHLFEMLILEGAQAGLSWITILKRREGYKSAFHQFDPAKVAAMSDEELEALMHNPSLIRNPAKIFSARQNARVYLEIQWEWGSFDRYLQAFAPQEARISHEIPTQTPESKALSSDLKKRGMTFVGPTILYAFMQAVGLVNDHLPTCPKFLPLRRNP